MTGSATLMFTRGEAAHEGRRRLAEIAFSNCVAGWEFFAAESLCDPFPELN